MMPTETSLSSTRLAVVLVRSGNLFCALPLESVIETLRSPPITAIAGAPEWVQGVAVIRGATVVVVDLGIMLGASSAEVKQPRLVTLHVGARVIALAVESITGVRELIAPCCPKFRRSCCKLIRRCSPPLACWTAN